MLNASQARLGVVSPVTGLLQLLGYLLTARSAVLAARGNLLEDIGGALAHALQDYGGVRAADCACSGELGSLRHQESGRKVEGVGVRQGYLAEGDLGTYS